MKKIKLAVLFLLITVNCFAQYDVRGGMGIQFQSIPSMTDYINQGFAPPSEQLASFTSAVNFSVEVGSRFGKNSGVGLELAYEFSSFTYNYDLGQFNFYYGIFMPSVIYYYIIDGAGYNFKFGAGAGIRLVNVEHKLPSFRPEDYSSTGFGALLKIDGNTLLSGKFYANIGGDIRYDINGEPKNAAGNGINNPTYNENVNLNSFSVGVRLGITYQF